MQTEASSLRGASSRSTTVPPVPFTPEDEARLVETQQSLEQARKQVEQLTELRADLINAAVANGRSYRDIAKIIGISHEAVATAAKRKGRSSD